MILDQFWNLDTDQALFSRKSISIDRYIDFRSIDYRFLKKHRKKRVAYYSGLIFKPKYIPIT